MRYDVIIIGAGSAGSTLAARLSEDHGRSVLLLEAGPDYPEFDRLPDDLKWGNNFLRSALGPHNWGYVATVTSELPSFRRQDNGESFNVLQPRGINRV